MTDNRTTELREKLDNLIIELGRLDITLDSPASDMTIGEYEQEREKLLDGFIQAIAATLGSGTCEVESFDDGVDEGMDGELFSYAPPTWYLSCGHTAQGTEMPNFCPVCGKAVKR